MWKFCFVCSTELLEVGDRILAVNGTSTEDITHDAVVRLLQTAGTTAYLEIEYDLPEGGAHYGCVLLEVW